MGENMANVSFMFNGESVGAEVPDNTLLVEFIRETLGKTGTHIGCDTSQCGACVIHINGESVKSCTMLAVMANGQDVTTIEGIADGDKILRYIRETAAEYDVERYIRYQHKVIAAHWSSLEKRWRVTAERGDTGELITVSCKFIFSCSGYYDYDSGYTPDFEGVDQFQGQLFHAQKWPEALDYEGKRVVVVGSGATAVTLVPTMSHHTSHLVMLQRSPTYIATVPQEDPTARVLRKFLPISWAFRVTRWKKVIFQIYLYRLSRRRPKGLRRFLLDQVRQALGPDYDVTTHFTPRYNPWDQRLCAVPDGDMFAAIREGRAEVVTDHIDHFTATGLQLKSGAHLEADIVVLASGDGDFDLALARVKRSGAQAWAFGVEALTAQALIKAADRFIAIDESLLLRR